MCGHTGTILHGLLNLSSHLKSYKPHGNVRAVIVNVGANRMVRRRDAINACPEIIAEEVQLDAGRLTIVIGTSVAPYRTARFFVLRATLERGLLVYIDTETLQPCTYGRMGDCPAF